MKIVLFSAVGLAVGIGVGTGVGALKHKKILSAELMARQDSIAMAQADSLAAVERESVNGGAHGSAAILTPEGEVEFTANSLPPGAERAQVEAGDPIQSYQEEAEAGGLGSSSDSTTIPDPMSESTTTPRPAGNLPGAAGAPSPAPDSALGEEGPLRLAKIFGAMDPDEAAKVLENLEDAEVQSILKHISDRKVAAILTNFEPARAATLSRVVMRASPGGAE